MTAPAPASAARIASLDVIRGVAVMGILVANMPAFGLPESAYFSPLAWGGSTGADRVAWFVTFVAVEGKMRGLFSFLFGASMLLVIDRAEAAGNSPAGVHFSRMGWLFAIGLVHLYGLWWGDILTHYALVGAIAFLFVRLPVRMLVALGLGMVALQALSDVSLWLAAIGAAARDTPQAVATWAGLASAFGVPGARDLAAEIAANRGAYAGAFAWRWTHTADPLAFLLFGAPETLGYMLLGMAGLRSGFLTGTWRRPRYRRWAIVTFGITVPLYVLLACDTIAHGFDLRQVIFASLVAATPLRPLMIAGYASIVILLMRPGGRLTARIAAAGRTAFTNYLGTTILMTTIFQGYGLGQYGQWSRAQLYLIVPVVWAIMLGWSQPWLTHFRYGPLEWVWRSLAGFERQPMRGAAIATN